jgi:hypothetical protein
MDESTKLASNKSGKQDVFYFEESPVSKSIDRNDKNYSRIYEQIPVILLFGWAGAVDRHLEKYSIVYTSLGYHTLRFAPSNGLTFLRSSEHKNYAYRLLDLMKEDLNLSKNPIAIHGFSNACGFVLYHHIINELNTEQSQYEFFKRNHRSLIIDSAFGWTTKPLVLRAGISDLIQSQVPIQPFRFLLSSFFVTLAVGYHFLHLGEHYYKKAFDTITRDKRDVPTLMIYSKADKLISAESIEQMANARMKLYPNLYVKKVVYEDAEHVLIYVKHMDEYLNHVKEHLKLCKLDIDENALLKRTFDDVKFKSKL